MSSHHELTISLLPIRWLPIITTSLQRLYGNVVRDLPDHGVAPWVSANDKPMVLSKPVTGDAAEQRLKVEVMKLAARDRRRLKEVPDVRSYAFWGHAEARLPFYISWLTSHCYTAAWSHGPCHACNSHFHARISSRQTNKAPWHSACKCRRPQQDKYLPMPQTLFYQY